MSATLSSADQRSTIPLPRVDAALPDDRPAAAGQPVRPPVGDWTWHPTSGAWHWSAALLELLALPASAATESRGGRRNALAGLRLPHVHSEDRLRLRTALEGAALHGRPFAVDVRVLCGDGRVAHTTFTGARDAEGEDPGVSGLVVDVTEDRARPAPADDDPQAALRREVEQLRGAMASRALIEQAKGVLMALVTCSDQVAFDLLGHLSSHTHRKVREVAALVVDSASGEDPLPVDLQQILRDACPPVVPVQR